MDDFQYFQVPDLDQVDFDEMEPVEFGYPEKDLGGVDLIDNARTSIGNQQGPLPQAELDKMSASQLRQVKNQRFEAQMGWAKPVAQFINTISSPAVAEGMVIGPINAVSKLGNALGDVILRKEVDTSDAWQIDQKALAPYNPLRGGDTADTEADPYGYEVGAEASGEALGALTGSTAIRQLKRVPQLVSLANKARQTQTVKNLAVAAKTNKYLRRGINLTRWGGEAVIDTSLAALFQDADFGNTMDLLGLFGVDNAPLMTQEENNYLENFGNKLLADGLLLPLSLIGASQVAPFTRRLADGNAAFGLDELADVELAPYKARQFTQPQLPPAGPEQFDSAIDRTTAAQVQVQAVQRQRDRVEAMGLILKNPNGQYAFDITGVGGQYGVEAPTPELQLKPKQTSMDLDYEFGDAPDPRPEITTYLAELDELDDQALLDTLRNVDQTEQLSQRQIQLEETQGRVTELQQQLADTEARMALPEGEKGRLTEQGGKRKLNKFQAELEQAQLQVSALAAEPLQSGQVGDQLAMRLDQQIELDLTEPGPELPEMKNMTWNEEAGLWMPDRPKGGDVPQGYASAADYRNDLMSWPRDLLRKFASPKVNPDVAAIVKARTGKRVWSVKKSDIVDALVELAERQGKYAEKAPETEQLPLELQQTLNLNEEPTPQLRQKQPMSADEREQLKKRILEIAIENGEVQPDVTPIPTDLPSTEFNQGELIETLFEVDDNGQLKAFSYDQTPTYKASGKKAEALIEEMRQRFDWALLDGQAQRAAQQQMAEQMGWNKLTWEEKKRSGLISQGFYAQSEGLVKEGPVFEWTPAGPATAEQAAAMKPKAPARKRKAKETTSPQVKNARKNRETAEAKVAAIKAQLAKATCDG